MKVSLCVLFRIDTLRCKKIPSHAKETVKKSFRVALEEMRKNKCFLSAETENYQAFKKKKQYSTLGIVINDMAISYSMESRSGLGQS